MMEITLIRKNGDRFELRLLDDVPVSSDWLGELCRQVFGDAWDYTLISSAN